MPVAKMKELVMKIVGLGLFTSCASKPRNKKNIKKSLRSAAQRRCGRKESRVQQPQQQQHQLELDAEFSDKYTAEKVIGRGGFGTVYAGYRNSDHTPVAIKVARKSKALGWIETDDGQLMPREVWCLQRVTGVHGVIRLMDYYDRRSSSSYIVVMDRPAGGQDLFDYITEHGPLDEATARDFIQQVVSTLVAVHAAGVVHRDIKDENLIVEAGTKQLRLIDFGSATGLTDAPYTDFDGTLVYSSPEWLLRRRYKAVSYTVWTLGILLYDMVRGNIPFHNRDAILRASPTLPDRLSAGVRSLICRCLSADPDQRPTLQQILADPWVTSIELPTDSDDVANPEELNTFQTTTSPSVADILSLALNSESDPSSLVIDTPTTALRSNSI